MPVDIPSPGSFTADGNTASRALLLLGSPAYVLCLELVEVEGIDDGKGMEAGSMTSVSPPLIKLARSSVLGKGVDDGAGGSGGSLSPTQRSMMLEEKNNKRSTCLDRSRSQMETRPHL